LVALEGKDGLCLKGPQAMGHSRGSCSFHSCHCSCLGGRVQEEEQQGKEDYLSVRDHIIPHLTRKTCAYEMWASLCKLYKSSNENRKMVLHDRLRGIHMLEDESVTSFLGRYTQIRDEFAAVREVVNPNSLVRQAMNSFTKLWGPFVRGIVAKEVMPTWERMWDDFVQEEIRLAAEASGQQQTVSGDENLALWTKGKKKTNCGGRQGPKFGAPPQGGESSSSSNSGQRRDMSTVRCFACGEMGHYVG
jgi:hypothetical protein